MRAAPGDALLRLGLPRPARVELGDDGRPAQVDGRAVEAPLGLWVVEEGWWTDQPVRRRYHELALAGGRLVVVFEDLEGTKSPQVERVAGKAGIARQAPDSGRWYVQRA